MKWFSLVHLNRYKYDDNPVIDMLYSYFPWSSDSDDVARADMLVSYRSRDFSECTGGAQSYGRWNHLERK